MFAWLMNRQVTPFGSFSGLPLVGLGSLAVQMSIVAREMGKQMPQNGGGQDGGALPTNDRVAVWTTNTPRDRTPSALVM